MKIIIIVGDPVDFSLTRVKFTRFLGYFSTVLLPLECVTVKKRKIVEKYANYLKSRCYSRSIFSILYPGYGSIYTSTKKERKKLVFVSKQIKMCFFFSPLHEIKKLLEVLHDIF